MLQFANQTAALQTSMEQSQANFKAEGEGLQNQAARLNIAGDRSMLAGRRLKNQASQAMSDAKYAQDVFNKLTVPSFALANRQGKREMEALKLVTSATLMDASMPYRDPIIFEPQRALPGLEAIRYWWANDGESSSDELGNSHWQRCGRWSQSGNEPELHNSRRRTQVFVSRLTAVNTEIDGATYRPAAA